MRRKIPGLGLALLCLSCRPFGDGLVDLEVTQIPDRNVLDQPAQQRQLRVSARWGGGQVTYQPRRISEVGTTEHVYFTYPLDAGGPLQVDVVAQIDGCDLAQGQSDPVPLAGEPLVNVRVALTETPQCMTLPAVGCNPGVAPGRGDFCWEKPAPHGNALRRVWALPGGEVWAVGEAGTVMHRRPGQDFVLDTEVWKVLGDRPDDWMDLTGVWASGPDDVWVVGRTHSDKGGVVLHRDAKGWQRSASGTPLWGVWGSSATDIWAVGEQGLAWHWSGWKEGKPIPVGTGQVQTPAKSGLRAVKGSGARDVWAVSQAYEVIRYDGTSWSQPLMTPTGLVGDPRLDVWSTGRGGAWVVGPHRTLLRCSETACQKDPQADGFGLHHYGVWGTDQDHVWTAGEQPARVAFWDGTSWTESALNETRALYGIHGLDATTIWTVGEGGAIYSQKDGGAWTQHQGGRGYHFDVRGRGQEIWVAGSGGRVLYWNGGEESPGWQVQETPAAAKNIYALWVGQNVTYAVRQDGVYRQDRGTRTWSRLDCTTVDIFTGIWGSSDTELYVVEGNGKQGMQALDGYKCTPLPVLTIPLSGVWGSGSDVYAFGWNKRVKYDARGAGSATEEMLPGDFKDYKEVWRLWGNSKSHIWAVNKSGKILSFQDAKWSAPKVPVPGDLSAIWGDEADNLWLVGYDGIIWRGSQSRWDDSSAWRPLASGTHNDLTGVWASSPDDLIVVGWEGTILRQRKPR